MADERMNYDSMEQMGKAFNQASRQLDETKSAMDQIAQTIGEGALKGQAGDAFLGALQKLDKRRKIINEKMKELEGDIQGAVSANRDGVKTAKSRFK
jgi:uncharacterized protein YukE